MNSWTTIAAIATFLALNHVAWGQGNPVPRDEGEKLLMEGTSDHPGHWVRETDGVLNFISTESPATYKRPSGRIAGTVWQHEAGTKYRVVGFDKGGKVDFWGIDAGNNRLQHPGWTSNQGATIFNKQGASFVVSDWSFGWNEPAKKGKGFRPDVFKPIPLAASGSHLYVHNFRHTEPRAVDGSIQSSIYDADFWFNGDLMSGETTARFYVDGKLRTIRQSVYRAKYAGPVH